MVHEAFARDVMQSEVITILPESSLLDAWGVLSSNAISGAPVVSREEGLVGVLSQTDLLHYILLDEELIRPQRSYYIGDLLWDEESLANAAEKLEGISVAEVMTRDVVTVAPDDGVSAVAVLMRTRGIHRVIVTDKANRVEGIITSLDLLKLMEQH